MAKTAQATGEETPSPSLPQRRERERGGSEGPPARLPRLIGWQGFTLNVPETWDLTGFSGNDGAGYLRIDDGEEQGLEIKWSTERSSGKGATPPDVEARRVTYFRALKDTARKKKLELAVKELDTYRPVVRPERTVSGFSWVGDRKAYGAVWYCSVCRRVVIAQALGERTGKGGLKAVAEKVLGSLSCHDADPDWRVWSLYDLYVEVPRDYALLSQQLMNVYLRLTFAKSAARLSVEQWAVANVARRDAYLDAWVGANAKGEAAQARYTPEEATVHGHPAIRLEGGPAVGLPMAEVVKQVGRLQRPATRFTGLAWECTVSNKIHLVEAMRPPAYADPVPAVAARTLCHRPGEEDEEGGSTP